MTMTKSHYGEVFLVLIKVRVSLTTQGGDRSVSMSNSVHQPAIRMIGWRLGWQWGEERVCWGSGWIKGGSGGYLAWSSWEWGWERGDNEDENEHENEDEKEKERRVRMRMRMRMRKRWKRCEKELRLRMRKRMGRRLRMRMRKVACK